VRIAVVCFANTCRSPVAEAFLVRFLRDEPDVQIFSRGIAGGPGTTPEAMMQALSQRGLSLVSLSGEPLASGDLDADLFLFMERTILREAVVRTPALWPRSFTLREFARRAQLNPPQRESEGFVQWLGVLHGTRRREDLLGTNRDDDVRDPGLGGDVEAFDSMVSDLEALSHKVAQFLNGWPSK
jgi:protein-tyrosine-phosphatase